MTFTKKKLAAVISGTLLMGVAVQTVQAGINLDNTKTTATNDTLTYASEAVANTSGNIVLSDSAAGHSGTAVTGTSFSGTGAARQNIRGTLSANQIASDTDVRVSLTLSSGTFAAAPTLEIYGASAASLGCGAPTATVGTVACPTVSVFSGGTTADSTVTFDTNTGTLKILPGAIFEIDVIGVNAKSQSPITVDVGVRVADNFGPTDLAGFTGAGYISFAPLISVKNASTVADTNAIDVTQASLFFSASAGDTNKTVGTIDLTQSTAAPLSVGSTALTIGDVLGVIQKSVTAANGFSAMNQGTSVAGDAVNIAGVAATISTSDATKAALATAAVTAGGTGDAAGAGTVQMVVPTANTVQIAETTLVGNVAATGAATAVYSAANGNASVNLASLARNGSSARLTFALTPGGNYPMFVRFTNPSSISGAVTFTLTNDAGTKSSSVSIGSIAGVSSGTMAAGESTGLLKLEDVYAAVQAADPTFAIGATNNKLRLDANAAFGANGASSGLIVGAFSLSSDGTTFNMITNAGNRTN
jgi:hypothetical protein